MNNNVSELTPAIEQRPPSWLAQNGLTLAILAAFVGFFVYRGVDLTVVGLVAVGLGFVIFVHELGHFLAAKWCDVHVETFSIGFGPSLPYCQYKWGETTYKIGLIPLGGYVKMLGEGAESEEGEEDPRSYKNKSVGQRMVIISAGVIMNMLFAIAGFVGIYMGPGIDRISGVIGQVDPGSPAWQAGLPSGAQLRQVARLEDPFFDQIKPTIALAGKNVSLPISYVPHGGTKSVEIDIEPRYEGEKVGQKLIGIAPSTTTRLRGIPRLKIPAFIPNSAASRAEPALENNDVIVGITDPSDPKSIKDLPIDPRQPDGKHRDYFELQRRLVDSAGQPIQLEILREESNGSKEIKQVKQVVDVPPAFNRDLGLIMRMGAVFAVRQNSPAAQAGIKAKIDAGDGDIIESVEVTDAKGGITRFTNARSPQAVPGITEKPLDPVRLPFELEQWAATAATPKNVKVTVLRASGHNEKTKKELTLTWDDGWKYSREAPLSMRSPMSIPGLGIAYRVETIVEDVVKGSVSAEGGIKKDDEIKAVRLYRDSDKKQSEKIDDLANDEWAFIAYLIRERVNSELIDLFVKKPSSNKLVEVSLAPPEDKTWPIAARGFIFDDDTRHQHADSVTQAIAMGGQRVADTAKNVYLSLQRMVEGGISFWKNAHGPITIAVTSYNVAGESFVQFILLLSVLSVNLAVLNFLPIPVLDGGHMVFLLYEKARGRPMPEVVRTAATFAGMALLLSLMACVIFLDVWRLMKSFFAS